MLTTFKLALRRIISSKLYTVISLVGLTIGLAIATLLVMYIHREATFDHYHTKADRTYKVVSSFTDNTGIDGTYSITFGTLAGQYKSQFPEVEEAAIFYGPDKLEVDVRKERFNGMSTIYVDYSFPQIFDFGGFDPSQFNSPEQVLLSREAAEKLFGDANPIGQELEADEQTFVVSGVLDVPDETRFQFDLMLPVQAFEFLVEMKEGGMEYETYVVLKAESNNETTLTKLAHHYDAEMSRRWPLVTPHHFLLPIKEVYLNDVSMNNRMGNGSKQALYVVGSIALLSLLLAIVNYLNIQMANNHIRQKETKIKKIIGATKRILFKQSLAESILTLLVAGTFAIMLIQLLHQYVLTGLLQLDVPSVGDWTLTYWAAFLSLLLVLGLLAGIFPAVSMIRIGRSLLRTESSRLRKPTIVLVMFQFLISACLLSSILFIDVQMDFLKRIPLGYQTEDILVISNLKPEHLENYHYIKEQLLSQSGIVQVSGSQAEPGRGTSGQVIQRSDQTELERISINHVRTIDGYLETFQIPLLMGQDFSENGREEFILNETAYKKLYPEGTDPIGATVIMGGRQGKIVGIVSDYHYRSFHRAIAPLVLNVEQPYRLVLSVRLAQSASIEESLAHIKGVLAEFDPYYVMEYRFLDESFGKTYRAEILIKQIITYATVIALAISVLGLLALSIFIINNRTKEIAIRRTLGASSKAIFWNLSGRMVLWIVVSSLLAVPITTYALWSWLDSFVYQVPLVNLLWVFPVAMLSILIVSFAAILFKLRQAITLNPVKFLKYE